MTLCLHKIAFALLYNGDRCLSLLRDRLHACSPDNIMKVDSVFFEATIMAMITLKAVCFNKGSALRSTDAL
jgi:hypothetical protein